MNTALAKPKLTTLPQNKGSFKASDKNTHLLCVPWQTGRLVGQTHSCPEPTRIAVSLLAESLVFGGEVQTPPLSYAVLLALNPKPHS